MKLNLFQSPRTINEISQELDEKYFPTEKNPFEPETGRKYPKSFSDANFDLDKANEILNRVMFEGTQGLVQ
jgi:hypothetical protein